LAGQLKEIARQFSYDPISVGDTAYAEKVFASMEELAGKDSFDEEALYLRAFSLEKAKEFAKAKDIYRELINRFPQSTRINEALIKPACSLFTACAALKTAGQILKSCAKRNA